MSVAYLHSFGHRVLFTILLSSHLLPHAFACEPPELAITEADRTRSSELVRQLADPDYQTRNAAEMGLRKLGRSAIPALELATSDFDAEVRSSSRRLLTSARKADAAARIIAFRADTKGLYKHQLPGWSQYQAVAGQNESARLLFLAILDDPATESLRRSLAGQPKEAGQAIMAFRETLAGVNLQLGGAPDQQRAPTVAQIALLILAESQVSESYHRLRCPPQYPTANFFQTTSGRAAANGKGSGGEPFRALLMNWIEKKSSDGLLGAGSALGYAQTFDAPQALQIRCATRVMLDRNPHHETVLIQAAEVLANTQSADGWRLITLLFEDQRMLTGSNVRPEWRCEVRDAALALAIRATGQDPQSFGLIPLSNGEANKKLGRNYGFESSTQTSRDNQRLKAFSEWKKWEASQCEIAPPPRQLNSARPMGRGLSQLEQRE